jgi:hypothetical protein
MMIRLNVKGMSPETLRQYNAYLVSIRFDPMTSAESEAYLAERTRVATQLAFLLR